MAVVVSPADFERWQALEGERAADPNWTFKFQKGSARQPSEARSLFTPVAPDQE